MTNQNRQYFRETYPDQWIPNEATRDIDKPRRTYEDIALALLECKSGHSVCECGCGSGELLERLQNKHSGLRLTGIDLGFNSLKVAASRPIWPLQPQVTEADATTLPIASNQFDRVYASSLLWYVPDPSSAIREMIRILRPGGRFVFDVRNPFHVTNLLSQSTPFTDRLLNRTSPHLTFFTPGQIERLMRSLPVEFDVDGYFVLLPTRLPLLGRKYGNWSAWSPWLSYKAGGGKGRWLAQKLLISGIKQLS